MDRISTSTKAVDLFGTGKHGFKDGNLGSGILPTDLNAAWFNDLQEELLTVIEAAGITPTAGQRTQLYQAIQVLMGDYKASVRVATTAAITSLAGGAPNTLDGIALVAGNRVLVKDQATASENGIYVVTTLGTGANGTWTRTVDADQSVEVTPGMQVTVEEGSFNADTVWELSTDAPITLGTTGLTFSRKDAGAATGVPTGAIGWFAANAIPSGYLKANGAAISRTTYAALFAALVKTATVTISIATPGVVTWTAHGRSANDPVKFTSTGVFPTGITGGTTYYVVGASITTNTFQISATPGGAAINTTGSQSGIHTGIHAPFGDGDGSTTFNLPDLRGEFVRGWDDSRAIDTNRAFGVLQLDAMQGHQHTLGRIAFLNNGIAAGGNDTTSTPGNTGNPVTDGTNGTPRTAAETRPRNVAMLACIKF